MEYLLPFEKRNKTKKILIKHEEKTDGALGKKPEERTTAELLKKGIIILNKPSGPTSHQATDYRRIARKLSRTPARQRRCRSSC